MLARVLPLVLCLASLSYVASDPSGSTCLQVTNGQSVGQTKRSTIVRRMPDHVAEKLLKKRASAALYPQTPAVTMGPTNRQTGACGIQYSTSDKGVCVWNGGSNPVSANGDSSKYWPGWLSWSNKANCNKQVYLKNKQGKAVYAPTLEGCPMGIDGADLKKGCNAVWVTQATMDELAPQGSASVDISDWGFLGEVY